MTGAPMTPNSATPKPQTPRRAASTFALIGAAVLVCTTAGPADAFKAYVSNEKGNTVSVIDTDTLNVIKTIKVGQRPRGIALTHDEKFVLVAVGDDDTI